jgi:hypothetical protein
MARAQTGAQYQMARVPRWAHDGCMSGRMRAFLAMGFWGRFVLWLAVLGSVTFGFTMLMYQVSDAAGYSAARWWFWVALIGAWQIAKRTTPKPVEK